MWFWHSYKLSCLFLKKDHPNKVSLSSVSLISFHPLCTLLGPCLSVSTLVFFLSFFLYCVCSLENWLNLQLFKQFLFLDVNDRSLSFHFHFALPHRLLCQQLQACFPLRPSAFASVAVKSKVKKIIKSSLWCFLLPTREEFHLLRKSSGDGGQQLIAWLRRKKKKKKEPGCWILRQNPHSFLLLKPTANELCCWLQQRGTTKIGTFDNTDAKAGSSQTSKHSVAARILKRS